jgi:hypothetical protein
LAQAITCEKLVFPKGLEAKRSRAAENGFLRKKTPAETYPPGFLCQEVLND